MFNAESGVSSEHTLRLKAQAKKEITEWNWRSPLLKSKTLLYITVP